jgi:hypothetical protein
MPTERSPYYQVPITLSLKSISQKFLVDLHCLFCGMPFIQVSDQVVMVSDAFSDPASFGAGEFGPATVHCKRHTCKQRFRVEFAL